MTSEWGEDCAFGGGLIILCKEWKSQRGAFTCDEAGVSCSQRSAYDLV